jgi:hypothetical protein
MYYLWINKNLVHQVGDQTKVIYTKMHGQSTINIYLMLWKEEVLIPFAKFQKAIISFIMSICPSVRKEQLGSHWTDMHDILYLDAFQKFVRTMLVSLKSAKSNGNFTWPIYIFDISLSSS